MSRLGELRAPFDRAWRFLRAIPRAYVLGLPLLALGFVFMLAAFISVVQVVSVSTVSGAAAPGTTDRQVPFTATPLFQASLAVGQCGPQFYLLNDLEYADWMAQGRLPAPTLNCTRLEAFVTGRVDHLITEYLTAPGSPSVSYSITVVFWGEVYPYAPLSLVGAGMALGAAAWIGKTMLSRGTEKLFRQKSVRGPRQKTRK